MDSFEILTLILVPALIVLCCYLLMKRVAGGKRLFFILAIIWLVFNGLKVLFMYSLYGFETSFGAGMIWFCSIYLELLIFIIYALFYRKSRK